MRHSLVKENSASNPVYQRYTFDQSFDTDTKQSSEPVKKTGSQNSSVVSMKTQVNTLTKAIQAAANEDKKASLTKRSEEEKRLLFQEGFEKGFEKGAESRKQDREEALLVLLRRVQADCAAVEESLAEASEQIVCETVRLVKAVLEKLFPSLEKNQVIAQEDLQLKLRPVLRDLKSKHATLFVHEDLVSFVQQYLTEHKILMDVQSEAALAHGDYRVLWPQKGMACIRQHLVQEIHAALENLMSDKAQG